MSSDKSETDLSTDASDKTTKILLAEDDQDDRELFADALKEGGIEADITAVDNGQELIDTLKDPNEPNPDIVFLDLNMPMKNGKEALAEIKADSELKDIPTVILSTSGSPQNVHESFKAGADLYVQKPNSFRGLVGLLKTVFSFYWAGKLLRAAWDYFFLSEKHVTGKNRGSV